MKRSAILFVVLIPALLFVENCGSEEKEILNKAPLCSITNPFDNATIQIGTKINITVNASDVDGSIANVKVSIDGHGIKMLTSSPFLYEWNTSGCNSGDHTITALATDDDGLSASSEINIVLQANAPVVTTMDVTEVTASSAKCGGEISNNGGSSITKRGVIWSEESGVTMDNRDGSTEEGAGSGNFSSVISGLDAGTIYYVKAYATNNEGTSLGEEKSFQTLGLPLVTTNIATDITFESATLNGEVSENGGGAILSRGFVWNHYNEDMPTLDDNEGKIDAGEGSGTFTAAISSLDFDTDYQVRAYASSLVGTVYGQHSVFHTNPGPPAISDLTVSEITAHNALISGEITEYKGAKDVYITIVWSISPNPDISNYDGMWSVGYFSASSFQALITGLKSETEYNVRAVVGNYSNSLTTGNVEKFSTLKLTYTEGTLSDQRDGRTYKTVTIFGQTWMAENLAYLPEVCDVNTDDGYWIYDYSGTDVPTAKATANFTDYGVLYSQPRAKEACPAGWHLPSSDEWSLLEINIGMEYHYAYADLNRSHTIEGDKLKEVGNAHWTATYPGPNSGTNVTGFSALPGGLRNVMSGNVFEHIGSLGYFWTSTIDGNTELHVTYRSIQHQTINKVRWSKSPYENLGMSVRCVKD